MSVMNINYTIETTERTNEDQLVRTSDILIYVLSMPALTTVFVSFIPVEQAIGKGAFIKEELNF